MLHLIRNEGITSRDSTVHAGCVKKRQNLLFVKLQNSSNNTRLTPRETHSALLWLHKTEPSLCSSQMVS